MNALNKIKYALKYGFWDSIKMKIRSTKKKNDLKYYKRQITMKACLMDLELKGILQFYLLYLSFNKVNHN